MNKLFIIGNGFDRAHGLPTSYDEFKQFLSNTYMNGRSSSGIMPPIPSVSMGPKGEENCDMEEVAEFLEYIISEAEPNRHYWSELEDSLGRLDYEESFEYSLEEYDEDGDIDYWKTVYHNEDTASGLYTVIAYVKSLFSEWVNTIEITSATMNQKFYQLVNVNDYFLTFNYTEVLEHLYNVNESNVCHIHGKQGENILFGHGNGENYSDNYMEKNIGSENILTELDRFLKKDTTQALKNHQCFFDRMAGTIDEVYSMGFSFAEVDLIYIKEICKNLSENTVWYLNDYNPSEIPEFQKKIKQCGFKGKFSTFQV